jgi:hypothetical protein
MAKEHRALPYGGVPGISALCMSVWKALQAAQRIQV